MYIITDIAVILKWKIVLSFKPMQQVRHEQRCVQMRNLLYLVENRESERSSGDKDLRSLNVCDMRSKGSKRSVEEQ